MRWWSLLCAVAVSMTGAVLVADPALGETPAASLAADATEEGGFAVACINAPLPPACFGVAAAPQDDVRCPAGVPCAAVSVLGHAEGDVAASVLGTSEGPVRLTERAEMAHDGYLVLIERAGERSFDVRVLAEQVLFSVGGQPVGFQYASDPVDVAAPAGPALFLQTLRVGEPCDGLTLPVARCHPEQAIEVRTGADGHTFLHIDIVGPPFDPTFQGAVGAQVVVLDGGAPQRVEGYFNIAKLALPLDALDAVADVVRIT